MRRSTVAVLTAALISAIMTSMPPAAGGPPGGQDPRIVKAGAMAAPKGDFVPGELVVSFRPGLERAQARAVHSRFGATLVERIGAFRTDVVRLAPGASVPAAARAYGRRPEVVTAEPNWLIYPTFTPSDPSYAGQQWDLNNTGQAHNISDPVPGTTTHVGTTDADIDAAEAWDVEKGDPNTVVAVIDSGVDVNHPDLAGNIWRNPGEFGGTPGFDDDGNGYVDDIFGRDTAQDDNNLVDGSSNEGYDHGTHVAGTIAAVTDNATGVAGICGGDSPTRGCSIMVLKFMQPFAIPGGSVMGGTLEAELEAIAYAKREGADIINGSYGSPIWSPAERNAFKGAPGILAVLAAGNDSLDNDMAVAADLSGGPAPDSFSPLYPASYNLPNILSVAASSDEDRYGYFIGCDVVAPIQQCEFSSFGRFSVDVAAPGVDILSTVPTAGPDYDNFNGTSMAAPHVAGVAGLLESDDPTLTTQNLKNKIMNGVDTTGLPLNSELNFVFSPAPPTGKFTRTAGRLNANNALGAPTTNASPNHDGDIPGAGGIAGRKNGSVNWPNDVNDIFKKKLRRGKTYRMTLAVPAGKDYDLYVEKPGTVEIWQRRSVLAASVGGPGADETIIFKARKSKVHYIHVSSWFTDGNYTLRVRCLNC